MIHGKFSKNTKVLNEGNASLSLKERFEEGICQDLEQGLAKAVVDCRESATKQKCSICAPNCELLDNSCEQSAEESSGDGGEDNKSLAIVPVQKEEAASSSISLLIKEIPELKPGWPLLHRTVLSDRKVSERSLVRQISVVQWALRLPSRHYSCTTISDHKQIRYDQGEDQSSNLDAESGAIVPVATETLAAPRSPEHCPRRVPKELEGLHEKYSSTCRLFMYQELLSATSNFLPGLFWSTIHI
jgi:hypothetical protein